MIFNFDSASDLGKWYTVNDTVMGGISSSRFELNEEGHALFTGNVSTANNGGFASVRFDAGHIKTEGFTHIILKIKGDGSTYQFRLKHQKSDRHSYVYDFDTSGKWESITIPLSELSPQFRGRKLSMTDFEEDAFEELGILIGNKKDQSFQLMIDQIRME
ncbi:CIA30 family protein [Nonlabens xiamenensis]|uniref:CIA30 family protein n=1 Tax=Nonlabens xiamenensis TaxID=2341043 RepID=UPI000F60DAA4|nr:CIA30 family protein [Nonlabens xiamenensis]